MKKGNPFGCHRVIEPKGALPQPAHKISNDMEIFDNEMLVDVDTLNIDSASFTQLKDEAAGDVEKIKKLILNIVNTRGKMQNPVTGSGGMFIGTVEKIGAAIKDKVSVKPGDKIASLVSLSLTPLRIDEILEVKKDIDQVRVKGKAVLFETGIYAKLPADLPQSLALAVLDVAGAPAQTAKLVRPGNTVVVIGASGKSGLLCCYEARKRAGISGKIIGLCSSESGEKRVKDMGFCDHVVRLSATDAVACYEKIHEITGGKLADLVINCVNIPNTEMSSIMMTRDGGIVYFFSMATSFTKAALGAEGIGKDVDMIIGNGYTKDHAAITINILRESEKIRKLYGEIYC